MLVWNWPLPVQSAIMITSLPKLNLPVFDGDPCAWPKKRAFLWRAHKICEMTAVDWSPNGRKLDHLCDLEIRKPIEHEEFDVLIGSDYYKKLLLPLEHHIEIPGEHGGVKTPLVWTIVGHVSETANACTVANCVYTFHATFTPKMS